MIDYKARFSKDSPDYEFLMGVKKDFEKLVEQESQLSDEEASTRYEKIKQSLSGKVSGYNRHGKIIRFLVFEGSPIFYQTEYE